MTAPALPAPPRCFSVVGTRGIRVTLLDACGRPVYGPRTQAVTGGIVSVELEPEVEEGEEYSQVTAGGEQCFPPYKGQDSIKWWNVSITFCLVDPELYLIMNRTWKRVTDYSRQATTGWRMGSRITDVYGFALETWPKAAGSGVGASCLDDADTGNLPEDYEPGGYFLLPWVIPGAPEALTLENAPTEFTITGRTKGSSLWGRGPYNVVRDEQNQAAPLLDPIDPGFDVPSWEFVSDGDPDHFHGELTTVRPPRGQCGAQPLWNQNATPPEITVEAASAGQPNLPRLTVTNFAEIGNSGTVDWGDGTTQPVPASSEGTVVKADPYPEDLYGTPVTITFTAANGAEPVTVEFTPEAPPAAEITVEPVSEQEPNRARLTVANFATVGAGTVDWGDGTTQDVAADSEGIAEKADPYAEDLYGQEVTVTYTPTNGSDPVTATFTPAAPPVAAEIAVEPVSDEEPNRARLTVTNFAAVGSGGTVDWGDETTQEVPSDSDGTVEKAEPYAADLYDTEVTVTYTPANGSGPVTAPFTPTAPPEPAPTVPEIAVAAVSDQEPNRAQLTVTNFADIGSAGTVDWGDETTQDVPADSEGVVAKTDPYAEGLYGTPVTITFTATNGADPVTTEFTPAAPPAEGQANARRRR